MSTEMTLEELLSLGTFDSSMYVYYDIETGNVLSVSNEKNESLPFIKVEASEVSTIVSGKENVGDYKVVLDLASKEYVLQAYYDKEAKYLSWDTTVYRFPVITEFNNTLDVLAIQDQSLGTWTFQFSSSIHKILVTRQHYVGVINFYITKFDDANVLYETIRIDIGQIDKDGKIIITSNTALTSASVYCFKVFDSYGHLIK